MKQLRHRYSPPRRGGREARARQGEALIEDPRNASPVGRSVKRSAGVVSSAERFAGLTTPSAPDGASTPPLRGGVDRNREVELKAELRRVQQQQQQQYEREQLREALRRYEELYTFAPMSLISLDRRGMILDLNERAARMLAFPIEWLRGRPFLVFVARHDVSRFLEVLARLRRESATATTSADPFVYHA